MSVRPVPMCGPRTVNVPEQIVPLWGPWADECYRKGTESCEKRWRKKVLWRELRLSYLTPPTFGVTFQPQG